MSSSHIFGAQMHGLLHQTPVYSTANPQSPVLTNATIPATAQDLIRSWHNTQSLLRGPLTYRAESTRYSSCTL